MRPLVIIQARMGSTRLPGKVLKPILGRPMLWHIVRRMRYVPGVADVVVATSDKPGDKLIHRFCRENGIAFFAGSETDVLDRFYRTAAKYNGDPLIRITGDCPFADPEIVAKLLRFYESGCYDFVGVATGAGAIFLDNGRFPDGLDAECFSFAALELAWREATDLLDREHVTPYIWRNKQLFRCGTLDSEHDYSNLRWTVDHEADFQLVSRVYEELYREDKPFLMNDILCYMARHPELAKSNQAFIGKEGYLKFWESSVNPRSQKKEGDQ